MDIIDWKVCQQLAGNNLTAAKEFLALLLNDLRNDFTQMKNAFERQEFSSLQKQLHKLLGGLSYSGLPRLQLATKNLERALISPDKKNLTLLFNNFEQEVFELMNYFAQ